MSRFVCEAHRISLTETTENGRLMRQYQIVGEHAFAWPPRCTLLKMRHPAAIHPGDPYLHEQTKRNAVSECAIREVGAP